MTTEILCIDDSFLQTIVEYTNNHKTKIIKQNIFVGKNCDQYDLIIRKLMQSPSKLQHGKIYIPHDNNSLDVYVTDILTAIKYELMSSYNHYSCYEILRLIDVELELVE